MQGKQEKRDKLGGERFGGGHAYLRARVRIYNTVGLARGGAADHIAYGHRPCAELLCLAHSGEGVGCLSRLSNCDKQGILADYRVSVSELRGYLDFGRYPGQLFEHELAD